MTTPEPEHPDLALIVDDDGTPRGVIDVNHIHAAATRLMYAYAAAAGDDDAIDAVAIQWAEGVDPDELGYICGSALSLMTRCVLAPTLEVLGTVSPELGTRFRAKLAEARDHAEATLGGGAR